MRFLLIGCVPKIIGVAEKYKNHPLFGKRDPNQKKRL